MKHQRLDTNNEIIEDLLFLDLTNALKEDIINKHQDYTSTMRIVIKELESINHSEDDQSKKSKINTLFSILYLIAWQYPKLKFFEAVYDFQILYYCLSREDKGILAHVVRHLNNPNHEKHFGFKTIIENALKNQSKEDPIRLANFATLIATILYSPNQNPEEKKSFIFSIIEPFPEDTKTEIFQTIFDDISKNIHQDPWKLTCHKIATLLEVVDDRKCKNNLCFQFLSLAAQKIPEPNMTEAFDLAYRFYKKKNFVTDENAKLIFCQQSLARVENLDHEQIKNLATFIFNNPAYQNNREKRVEILAGAMIQMSFNSKHNDNSVTKIMAVADHFGIEHSEILSMAKAISEKWNVKFQTAAQNSINFINKSPHNVVSPTNSTSALNSPSANFSFSPF